MSPTQTSSLRRKDVPSINSIRTAVMYLYLMVAVISPPPPLPPSTPLGSLFAPAPTRAPTSSFEVKMKFNDTLLLLPSVKEPLDSIPLCASCILLARQMDPAKLQSRATLAHYQVPVSNEELTLCCNSGLYVI